MWRIVEAMTRLIAPILSFTAEEVWEFLPKVEGRAASVHLALFPSVLEIVPGSVAGIEKEWEQLLAVRSAVMVELEAMRAAKSIGKSLDASVGVLVTERSSLSLVLQKHELALAEFFNVSQATVQVVGASTQSVAMLVESRVADGAKCGRCWRVVPDVGEDARWPEVCTRCAEALEQIGFAPMQGEAK
jgi:isoleucyl-tRNA synthetase